MQAMSIGNKRDIMRVETIGGVVCMTPPATTRHNIVAFNIAYQFRVMLKGRKCEAYSDGSHVILDKDNKFIPDAFILCDKSKDNGKHIEGAPDLVVEVMSPSTGKFDRKQKMLAYGKHGVKEYWIVDSNNQSVEVYYNKGEQMELENVYQVYDEWHLSLLDDEQKAAIQTVIELSIGEGLSVQLEDIFMDNWE